MLVDVEGGVVLHFVHARGELGHCRLVGWVELGPDGVWVERVDDAESVARRQVQLFGARRPDGVEAALLDLFRRPVKPPSKIPLLRKRKCSASVLVSG